MGCSPCPQSSRLLLGPASAIGALMGYARIFFHVIARPCKGPLETSDSVWLAGPHCRGGRRQRKLGAVRIGCALDARSAAPFSYGATSRASWLLPPSWQNCRKRSKSESAE